MNASVVLFPARPRRSIPMPWRRLEVRISVITAHTPYGRSRTLSIREHDLPELIACAEWLEARS